MLNLTFMQGMPFIFPSQAALYNHDGHFI